MRTNSVQPARPSSSEGIGTGAGRTADSVAPRNLSGAEVRQSFILTGAPRTKKNHGIIATRGGRPRMLPSPQFSAWNRIAQMQLAALRAKSAMPLPITIPINVSAHFYRDRDTGDLVNFMQALADCLQEGGIVEDDRLIAGWDGSRLRIDRNNPRIEVTLEACE